MDGDEVQLVDLDGVLAVDARVAGPEDDLAGSRIEQPSMVVVRLIRQCGGDLLNVDAVQIEHTVSSRTPVQRFGPVTPSPRATWR